jgi:membrane-associated protein
VDLLAQFIDLVLHLDVHLAALLAQYGTFVYVILFAIVFCETGLVVMPFLPGDSMLFVAGALAATSASGGSFDINILIAVLLTAAVLGDNTNYWIGRWAGKRILTWGENSRFFNRAAFDHTHAFYERHGGKTMMMARFLPFVRTFAPFVAGVAEMNYGRFFSFDFAGAVVWVFSLCLAGYWFGNLPWVKSNLSLIIFGIIGLTLLPLIGAWLRHRLAPTGA